VHYTIAGVGRLYRLISENDDFKAADGPFFLLPQPLTALCRTMANNRRPLVSQQGIELASPTGYNRPHDDGKRHRTDQHGIHAGGGHSRNSARS
jgi:hypothetical protein